MPAARICKLYFNFLLLQKFNDHIDLKPLFPCGIQLAVQVIKNVRVVKDLSQTILVLMGFLRPFFLKAILLFRDVIVEGLLLETKCKVKFNLRISAEFWTIQLDFLLFLLVISYWVLFLVSGVGYLNLVYLLLYHFCHEFFLIDLIFDTLWDILILKDHEFWEHTEVMGSAITEKYFALYQLFNERK